MRKIIRESEEVEDYDYFRDDSNMKRDSKKISAWNMFVRRGEPHMKARLLWKLGGRAVASGVVLEFIDHEIISSHALSDIANLGLGVGVASLLVGSIVATSEMVSEHNKHNNPPTDHE